MKKSVKNVDTVKTVDTVKVEKTAKTAIVTGLTLKGLPDNAEKVYGDKLKNGKENSYYKYEFNGIRYRIAVNFDSFDDLVKTNIDDVKTAEITATYKIRRNGSTVEKITVSYNGDDGEKFPTLRQFYGRKLTGGIDTAEIRLADNDVILYVNRMSKFNEFTTVDGIPSITEKVG